MDDPIVTNEDTPVLLDPLANDDLGPGAESLTVNNVPDPATEGQLTYLDATGNPVVVAPGDELTPEQAATLTFTAVEDSNGTVPPINYTVTDINGETSDADILIDVTPTPDAVDDPIVTNEDTPVPINPLTNDDDGAGADSVTVNTVPDPATEGALNYIDDTTGQPVTVAPGDVLSPTEAASLEFTPVEDFNGTVPPIEYTLTDINGETSDAAILIEVTPTPDAMDDLAVTNEDTPVAVDALANDDVGAGAQSVTINTIPDAATEGAFTYIDDATGLPVTIAAGDVLSPTEAASMEFTPAADFNGMVATVAYTVTDINGETSDANIDITVIPTPDAVDDIASGNEDTPVPLDPLANDDVGTGADSVEVLNVPDPATEGTLTYLDDLTGNALPITAGTVLTPTEAATMNFVPVEDFNGTVSTIGYEVTDVNGETSQAVIDIDIIPTPDAADDPIVVNEDTPVTVNPLLNDDDGAGVDSVTVDTVPDPSEGELTYTDADGNTVVVAPDDVLTPDEAATLTFTPADDFNGTVPPIEYTLTDINGEESSAEILIEVTPTPDAVDDPVTVNEDTPVLLDPLANDDPGPGAESVTVNNVPDPATEGALTYTDAAGNEVTVAPGDELTPEEAATLTFTPADDFNGTVPPINYTVTDINGEESSADILIDVTPTPDAVDDPFVANGDAPIAINPLTNDDDGTGVESVTINNVPDATTEGTLTYTDDTGAVQTVAPGDVLSPAEAATLMFNPAAEFSGTVPPINYTIEDVNGATSDADVIIDTADIRAAKAVVGTPQLLDNANYLVSYQVVVENTGTLNLADLSVIEDLQTQFGTSLVNVRGLILSQAPTDSSSNIVVDNAGWNGTSVTEILASSGSLAAGDSFVVTFDVEVDPDAAGAPNDTSNQVSVTGNAVDESGAPILDPSGTQLTANDLSDSGTDPNGANDGNDGDTGGTDDPTRLYLPSVGVAKEAGFAVPNADDPKNLDVTFTLKWENTGTSVLTNLALFDDLATEFGESFLSVSGLTVQNFNGTGTAPTANGAWAGDTTRNLLVGGTANQGDSFEVTFVATLQPNADGTFGNIENQAQGAATAVDDNGNVLTDSNGAPLSAFDLSDEGDNPTGENGTDNTDGVPHNDPTVVEYADLDLVKELVDFVETDSRRGTATFRLIVENTGTAALGEISLLEDLATQFGDVLDQAGNLTLVVAPTDGDSSVTLNATAWDGVNDIELLDQSVDNVLAAGDQFVLEFTTDLITPLFDEPLENQITGSGAALDENGDPILDANGDTIVVSDASDSSADPPEDNTDDDPTIINPIEDDEPSGTSGNPPNTPGFAGLGGSAIAPLLSNFTSSPGPIYSGRDVVGGFSGSGFGGGGFAGGDGFAGGFGDAPIVAGDGFATPAPFGQPLVPIASNLAWSLEPNSDVTGSRMRITLDGDAAAGQTASVELNLNGRDLNRNRDLDQKLIQRILEAIDRYDGPGRLTFDGQRLTFSADQWGNEMAPLFVDLPVAGEDADEFLKNMGVLLDEAQNSTIDRDGQGGSDSIPPNPDLDVPTSRLDEAVEGGTDMKVSFLKRFTSWLSKPTDV